MNFAGSPTKKGRLKMVEENLFFNSSQKYVVLDTETNSLNLVSTLPFEVSWIVADKYSVVEKYDEFLLWKDFKMSSGAAKITGFNKEDYLSKAIDPNIVYDRLSKYLLDPSYVIVGQNIINFDSYVIKNLQKSLGKPVDYSWLKRCVDTRALFIALQRNIKYNQADDFLAWQYKVLGDNDRRIKSSEKYMLDYFEIKHDQKKLHNALYDVEMLYKILMKLLPRFEVPDLAKGKM